MRIMPAIQVLAAAALLLMTGGCRKELCYDHDHWKADVQAEWDNVWERDYGRAWQQSADLPGGFVYDSLRPAPGTGIAALVYGEDGTATERHLGAAGGVLPVGEGEHPILMYNDNTEYIVFSSMNSWAEASATTRTRLRSTFSMDHGNDTTVNSPDMLYGAWISSYEVTLSPDGEPEVLPVVMKPLVYRYLVIFEFESGIEYVQLARGALSGMAQSVFLQNGRTGPGKATVLFDGTDVDQERSLVSAVVNSFGVPDFPDKYYPGKAPGEVTGAFGLNLEVMLPDGKIKSFDFDISAQMSDQPRGGVIVVSGIEVSESDFGGGGGNGFSVDVSDWGDYEDITLPL